MNTKTKNPFEAGFFASLSLGVGIVLGASEYDRNIEKDFPVSPGGKLIVEADRGSIEVNSDTSDKIHVRVLRRVKGGSQAQADEFFANHEVTFKQDGNTVAIIGRNTKDRFRFWSIRQPSLQVRYEISIPKKFDVDLKTSGGDVAAQTSSGSIGVGRANGKRVTAKNSGGKIEVNEARDVVLWRNGFDSSWGWACSTGNGSFPTPDSISSSRQESATMHWVGRFWTSTGTKR